jgi:hypothetical protein
MSKQFMKNNKIVLLMFLIVTAFPVKAYDINTKGFLTFAYSVSDSEIPYTGNITADGEYSQGTKAGLQFSSVLSPKVDAFLQILADGDSGRDFNFALDIAHVNYNINNDHKIIYGKIRLPVWMISDYRQVGALYPWINPPEEVYDVAPLEDIGANDTFFGISLEGNLFHFDGKEMNYRLYTGGSERVSEKENNGGQTEIRIRNLAGALLTYSHSDFFFKLSHLNVNSEGERFDYDIDDHIASEKFVTSYSSLGFKYDNDSILMMSEYSHVKGDTKEIELLKSYYVMMGIYFLDNDLLIHSTYSDIMNKSKTNRGVLQSTLAFGVNYNLDISTILKIEHKSVMVKNDPRFRPDDIDEEEARPAGFFDEHPGKDVGIVSVSINTMF